MVSRSRNKQLYVAKRAKINHNKKLRREAKKRKLLSGWLKFLEDVRKKAIKNKRGYTISSYERQRVAAKLGPKPKFSETINYLASKKQAFAPAGKPLFENGYFVIPKNFSLSKNYSESFSFLNRLFYALYYQSSEKIVFDYIYCEQIDVDASVCMDIMLQEFISYYEACRKAKRKTKVIEIAPKNYKKPYIEKILFSIGAFSNIKNFNNEYSDILAYKLCIGDLNHPEASSKTEIDITNLVDYVINSMKKMNRDLTATAERNLFTVIGEVLTNAEEHSTVNKRYSIGYFQDSKENGEHVGIFNLAILNFGKTIYEKFNDPDCPNRQVVERMKELSHSYTKRKLFSSAEFEEETLWTLYALQEGVTTKAEWKRGNGSIRFLDSFFKLKGDNERDNISYLSIVSGNTHIIFDGTYRLIEKVKGMGNRKYQMMTFNDSGNIENKPDKKFVIFADNYFPGTIISAKICIKENNTEAPTHENN